MYVPSGLETETIMVFLWRSDGRTYTSRFDNSFQVILRLMDHYECSSQFSKLSNPSLIINQFAMFTNASDYDRIQMIVLNFFLNLQCSLLNWWFFCAKNKCMCDKIWSITF